MDIITNNWDVIIALVAAAWVVINWIDGKVEKLREEIRRETDETTRKVGSAHSRIDEVQRDHINLLMHMLSEKK